MKAFVTTVKWVILCLLLMTLLVLALQRALEVRKVSTLLAAKASRYLGVELSIRKAGWRWLPVPSLLINGGNLRKGGASLEVKEIELHPSWPDLLRGNVVLSKVVLVSPELRLTRERGEETHGKGGGESPGSSPRALPTIRVVKGSVRIDPAILPPPWNRSKVPYVLDHLNGSVSGFSSEIIVNLVSSSILCEGLEMNGRFSLDKGDYWTSIKVRNLKMEELFRCLDVTHHMLPASSLVTFRIDARGNVFKAALDARVVGEIPCYIMPNKGNELEFSCGRLEARIHGWREGIRVEGDQAKFLKPSLSLTGYFQVSTPLGRQAQWDIDLMGEDIGVEGVNRRLKALWPGSKTVREVTSVVLGGEVASARFRFLGPTSNFKHLENMSIWATARDASIHVPDVDLDLHDANGSIEIIDGVLRGRGLSAWLGDSYGSNGTIVLGLEGPKEERVFKLDLNIRATSKELVPVLERLVPFDSFKEEVRRLKGVSGWANGRLTIGDRLHHFDVFVNVDSMDISGKYARWPDPIHVTRGRLRVVPGEVAWEDIEASVGEHHVNSLGGKVRWKGGEGGCLLNISRGSAEIDGASLLKGLSSYKVLEARLSNVVSAITGRFRLDSLRISGPWDTPGSWVYSFSLTPVKIVLDAPLLPGIALVEGGLVSGDGSSLRLKLPRVQIGESRLSITGRLLHSRLSHWRGRLRFSGGADRDLGEWIKAKEWIPGLYFPRFPLEVVGLEVEWGPGVTAVSGGVRWPGYRDGGPLRATLDFYFRPGQVDVRSLKVVSGERRMSMSLSKGEERLRWSFSGDFGRQEADRIFEHNQIVKGSLAGEFDLALSKERGGEARGWVKASGLVWHWWPYMELLVRDFGAIAEDGKVDIKAMALSFGGEEVEAAGTALASSQGIQFDLDLISDQLHLDNLKALAGVGPPSGGPKEDDEDNVSKDHDWTPFYGLIHFNVARLLVESSGRRGGPSGGSWTYLVSGLEGTMELGRGAGIVFLVDAASACTLDLRGQWRSGDGTWHLTASGSGSDFQSLFSCAGYPQDLVTGKASLNVTLSSRQGGTLDGNFTLIGKEGRINRMTLLSKVLSVINITDLFTKNGLPDMMESGFAYRDLEIDGVVEEGVLAINHGIIKGAGLNIFGTGKIRLDDWHGELVLLVAPFKTIDSIITSVPLVGKPIGGADQALVAFPVGVKGDMRDPDVTILPPEAVGEGLVGFVFNTLKLPFTILKPVFSRGQEVE